MSICPYIIKSGRKSDIAGAKSTQSLVWLWKGVKKGFNPLRHFFCVIFMTYSDFHHFMINDVTASRICQPLFIFQHFIFFYILIRQFNRLYMHKRLGFCEDLDDVILCLLIV